MMGVQGGRYYVGKMRKCPNCKQKGGHTVKTCPWPKVSWMGRILKSYGQVTANSNSGQSVIIRDPRVVLRTKNLYVCSSIWTVRCNGLNFFLYVCLLIYLDSLFFNIGHDKSAMEQFSKHTWLDKTYQNDLQCWDKKLLCLLYFILLLYSDLSTLVLF